MILLVQLLIIGLALGSIYALVALGFVLIYKSSGVINFAQGDTLTMGAFILWSLFVWAHLPFWLGVLVGFGLAALLGLAVERFVLRPMIGQPLLAMIMVTIGLSSMLSGITNMIWAGPTRMYPDYLPNISLAFGALTISEELIACVIMAFVTMLVFLYFFRRTRIGLDMRAVADGQQVARSVGISVTAVIAITWALATMVSMLGGLLLGTIQGVNQGLFLMGLTVFPVVLLGGLESIPGAIAGGVIIGIAQTLAIGYIDPLVGGGMGEVFPFIIMILILLVRPYGLFGLARIERI